MTKITELSLNRRFEKGKYGKIVKRAEKIDIPRRELQIECGNLTFKILVSPGQAINTTRVCKKLLKLEVEKINGNKKSFISKGFQQKRG